MRKIQVQVVGYRGEKLVVDVCDTEEQMKSITVLQLQKKIIETLPMTSEISMVFSNLTMEESSPLSSYGIKHMSTISIQLKLPGGI